MAGVPAAAAACEVAANERRAETIAMMRRGTLISREDAKRGRFLARCESTLRIQSIDAVIALA
jgi:hypothetical protein